MVSPMAVSARRADTCPSGSTTGCVTLEARVGKRRTRCPDLQSKSAGRLAFPVVMTNTKATEQETARRSIGEAIAAEPSTDDPLRHPQLLTERLLRKPTLPHRDPKKSRPFREPQPQAVRVDELLHARQSCGHVSTLSRAKEEPPTAGARKSCVIAESSGSRCFLSVGY